MNKTTQLKWLLQSKELHFLMGAYDGLSARLVEESGFKAIWAGSLGITAQLGVRDNNEASWTQILEVVEFMNDAVSIPILLDGDTGYGNFNNVRRLVKKLEQRGIAGVCIEDKVYPKTNSFIGGERQPLADIEEFCGRIKAGKDSQTDPDFVLVARVEALIAGWGMEEALKRAERYWQAGADAILIHSKKNHADEVLEFARLWKNRTPVLIVPTKYYSVPVEVYRKAGISSVIWANHTLRASIAAVQKMLKRVHDDEGVVNIEDTISPLNEIFRLQGAEELSSAERKYLSDSGQDASAVILAASKGDELTELTDNRPKCMLPLLGKPILERLVESLRKIQIKDITVVAGFCADAVKLDGVETVLNSEYETTNELASLGCALDRFTDTTLVAYGDILFRQYIVQELMAREGDLVMVVDSSLRTRDAAKEEDLVVCSEEDRRGILTEHAVLERFAAAKDMQCHGAWMGLLKVSQKGQAWIKHAFDRLKTRTDFNTLTLPDLLQAVVQDGHAVRILYIQGHWINVNRLKDVDRAQSFLVGNA